MLVYFQQDTQSCLIAYRRWYFWKLFQMPFILQMLVSWNSPQGQPHSGYEASFVRDGLFALLFDSAILFCGNRLSSIVWTAFEAVKLFSSLRLSLLAGFILWSGYVRYWCRIHTCTDLFWAISQFWQYCAFFSVNAVYLCHWRPLWRCWNRIMLTQTKWSTSWKPLRKPFGSHDHTYMSIICCYPSQRSGLWVFNVFMVSYPLIIVFRLQRGCVERVGFV